MNADEQTDRTIYVINWTPDSVGGFEWRRTAEDAADVVRDLADPTARIHAVELPAEIGDDPEGITAWLDSEGWSDGGDPQTPTPTAPAMTMPAAMTATLAAFRAAQTAERGAVVAVRTLAAADRLAATVETLADALDELADVFGDGMTAMHVGPGFTCSEAETIAHVLHLAGHHTAAESWLDGHAEQGEKEGDSSPEDLHHGRHIRGRILDRYSELLRRAANADPDALPGDAFRQKWNAARARLAAVDRYADGRDFTARYEPPGAA